MIRVEPIRRALAVFFAASLAVSLSIGADTLRPAVFIRGDANRDAGRDISDALFIINYLYLEGTPPLCPAALDSNDDEDLDLTDAVHLLSYLFLGGPVPPAPGPLPGGDPTPGLGCGLPGPASLGCTPRGPAVDLAFTWNEPYDSVEVFRDAERIVQLPGGSTAFRDRPPAAGDHAYEVRGLRGSSAGEAAACRVARLPANRPPTLTILSPAQGAVVDAGSIEVRGRASDDSAVVRVVAGGVEALPAGPLRAAADFAASVPVSPGPNLILIEAVDEFGRTTFAELAVGGRPLLLAGSATPGAALDITGSSGYEEIEGIVRPFVDELPALLNAGISGVRLFSGSVLGVDMTVTGERVEVSGPIGFDLFPSPVQGGRVGLRARFETVRLFADGRSDFGFLGTDAWDATWTAQGVTIDGTFALAPKPDRAGLDVVSDGFVVAIGGSSVAVSGFLDPFGIFDGVVNFLAVTFREEIEAQVRAAVEENLDRQLLPVLAEAFGSLNLSLNLGTVRLDTLFNDVREADRGLTVLFDALWKGQARSPSFPRYPGSFALFPPPPQFPLPLAAAHAVDGVFSLSADTLRQALAELTAGGLLETDIDLEGIESPIPLRAGTLAGLIDPRFVQLPGVEADTPLGLRVRARFPATIQPAVGVLGTAILAEGATWRYFKGTAEPPAAWKTNGFDDGAWESGPSGFGYSTATAEERSLRTRLDDMAAGAYTSLFARTRFTLSNPAALRGLFLRVYFDDAFVAYLNGREVGRRNLQGLADQPPPRQTLADGAIEPSWADIDLSPFRSSWRAGENILAIQGHNAAATSTDFVLLAELIEPAAPPPGALSVLPAQIDLRGLAVTIVADTAGDGVGTNDAGGPADDVDLLGFHLGMRLQSRLALLRQAGLAPSFAFELNKEDGPDPDQFPDSIVGGAAGIAISVAYEAYDIDDRLLVEFAEVLLSLFGSSIEDALAGFDLPSFTLPELAFDLNGDGRNDWRLEFRSATLVAADTLAGGEADWICILADFEPVRG